MLVRDIILRYTEELNEISTTPRLDVEILIMKVLGYENKIDLMMNYDKELNDEQLSYFLEMFNKRIKSMPIAYIVNKKEFMGLDFYVNENVLIPRPDTEIIVEDVINTITDKVKNIDGSIKVLDMCTGSGAIILSIASILKDTLNKYDYSRINFYGVDISLPALEVSEVNRNKFGLNNVKLINSDLFTDEYIQNLKGDLDIIVSNPPYIEENVIETLSPDVKEYEPIIALVGGEDGMIFYNKITEESVDFLKANGTLAFESGHDQADKIKNKMIECGYNNIYFEKDLQGFNRLVCGSK